ncbi:hypothetical protein [Acholeplasma hippikon]|uniref:Uncharacterized protein n=1 Tax=Acholeplasma hippikon TaxID=264636 RepID=A0A449BIQ5_9MOLU|nr:hypothetical protein [Acholeplasma hippikon]VEU82351.1 Uncharacterised protein [Acholeplasma hippikon]
MKKFLTLAVAIVATIVLVACGPKVDMDTKLEDAEHNYFVTGQLAGWGDAVGKAEFTMAATNRGDSRISSIVDDLKDAKFVYVIEATFSAEAAGWDVKYTIDGTEKTFDGNLTVKILQVNKDAEAPNWWGQNPESGKFDNLTPATLYLPPFQEANENGAGDWNGNPVVMEAGTYYIVYVQYANNHHGLAAIKK